MGKPEQGGSAAIVAVIVVGMLLLIVVLGGAAVLLGGLFFFSSDLSQQMTVVSSQPSVAYTAPLSASQQIELDEAGNITVDGAPYTPEEFRAHLLETAYAAPRIIAHADCPDDVRTNVASVFEEVLGTTPEFMDVAPMAEPPAMPLVEPSESN